MSEFCQSGKAEQLSQLKWIVQLLLSPHISTCGFKLIMLF